MDVDQGLATELQLGQHGDQGIEDREQHCPHAGEQEGVSVKGDDPLGVVEHQVQREVGLEEPRCATHDEAKHGAHDEL